MRARAVIALLAAALAGGCGGEEGTDDRAGTTAAPRTSEEPDAAPRTTAAPSRPEPPEPLEDGPRLPATEVDDLAGGGRVALDSLVPASRPVLVWFWAPW